VWKLVLLLLRLSAAIASVDETKVQRRCATSKACFLCFMISKPIRRSRNAYTASILQNFVYGG
jgi:hypothetical protein